MNYLNNGDKRHCFHTHGGTHFEALPNGAVRVFKAQTGRSMYYTHDKGFHQPETEIAVFDKNTWGSVVQFIADAIERGEHDTGKEG